MQTPLARTRDAHRRHRVTVAGSLAAVVWLARLSLTASGMAGDISPPDIESLPLPSAAEQRIHDGLDQRVRLEFVAKPLDQVVASLDHQLEHRIEIRLDDLALDGAGVPRDVPVTFHVRNVTLKSALWLLLKDLDLTYLVRDDVLLITTKDQADQPECMSTRVYPVGDLMDINLNALTDAITDTILTSSWDSVGGNASIVPLADCKCLVVSHSYHGHEQVLRLLRALRTAQRYLASDRRG